MTLQQYAEAIISKFDLLNALSPFGEVHLVGNVAFQTTVKPDIDIQIYSSPDKWDEMSDQIVNKFATIGLTDYAKRTLKQSGKQLTSFSYIDENNTRWTIDITQTEPSTDYLKDAYRFYLDFKDRLTGEKLAKIREIKQYFLDRDKLRNSMAYYIYRAILDFDAQKPEDIYKYIERNNVNQEKN